MKHFFLIVLSFLILNLVTNAKADDSGSSMKIEGSCTGTLADGTAVSFTYYSDFNGCQDVSKSAVTFTSGIEGLFTGERTFTETKDIHTYSQYKLSFANSTGNTQGVLRYTDAQGSKQTTQVQCDVRDYEYAEDC